MFVDSKRNYAAFTKFVLIFHVHSYIGDNLCLYLPKMNIEFMTIVFPLELRTTEYCDGEYLS